MEEKSTLDVSCALFSPRQVVIDLGAAPLDGEADWYTLTSHEESVQILVSQFDPIFNGQVTHLSVMCVCVCVCAQRRAGLQMPESATSPVGSVDHLSPPSTSSRLSDSEPDPSDLGDGEEGGGGGGGGSGGGGGGPLLPPSRHTRGALERSVRSDGASVSSMGSSSRYRQLSRLVVVLFFFLRPPPISPFPSTRFSSILLPVSAYSMCSLVSNPPDSFV